LLYLLLGEDDFSISQLLEEIKRGMGDQTTLVANTSVLDGQQVNLNQLSAVSETLPFLAERRLVIIEGLLQRFEPKSKPRRQKKASRIPKRENEHELFAACINRMPDTTVLVLIDSGIKDANPLLKRLSNKAEIRQFPLLKGANLRQWVQKRVSEEGGGISPRAVDLLSRLVGSNLWVLANEINKLVLFNSGRSIEEEDIKKVTSYAQQASVFAMVDAVLESKAAVAQQTLQQLLQRGASVAYLLAMLSRQVHMIVCLKELRKHKKTVAEIKNRLGLTSEFALRKTLEQADKYGLERLKEVYHKLLETDLSIKTGKYDDEIALNILVAELCQQGESKIII